MATYWSLYCPALFLIGSQIPHAKLASARVGILAREPMRNNAGALYWSYITNRLEFVFALLSFDSGRAPN